MKQLLTLLMIVGMTTMTFGQTEPKFVYGELVGTSKIFGNKATISVDYRQGNKAFPKQHHEG